MHAQIFAFRLSLFFSASLAPGEEGRVDALMERGKTRFEQKDYEGAANAFSKAVALAPKNSEAYLWRAKARNEYGAGAYSLPDLNRAIELNPKSGEAYGLRGLTRDVNNLGDRDAIVADYSKAIALNFQPEFHYFLRGTVLREKGEAAASLADLEKSLVNAGAVENSRRYWRGVTRLRAEDFEGAAADFTHHLKADKRYDLALLYRGCAYLRLGKTSEAEKDFAEYLKRVPTGQKAVDDHKHLARLLGGSAPLKPADYLRRALELNELDLREWALDDAARAVALDPKSSEGRYMKGLYLYRAGFYTSALAEFDAAIEVAPLDKRYYDWRAAAECRLNRWNKAIEDARRALSLDKQFETAYMTLARAYAGKNDWRAAVAACEAALEYDSLDLTAREWRHHARKYLGELDEARRDLDACLRLNTANVNYWIQRGELGNALGKPADAEADFAHALELSPSSAWAFCSRATLRFNYGDARAAEADADKAIQIDKTFARAFFVRGKIKNKSKEGSGAADLEKALWINPTIAADLDVEYAYFKFVKPPTARTVAKGDRARKGDSSSRPAMDAKDAAAPLATHLPGPAKRLAEDANAAAAKGDFASAVDGYTRAITVAPRYAEAYLHRGLAQLALGESAQAERDFSLALQIDPDLQPILEREKVKAASKNARESHPLR